MFVTVIHKIHDPEGFVAAEAKALEAGLPATMGLPVHAATDDQRLGVCIWEAESVEAVQTRCDDLLGKFAENDCHEMHVDGLTPQLQG